LKKLKVIHITTGPISIKTILKGHLKYVSRYYDMLAVSSEDEYFDEMIYNEGIKGVIIELTRKITRGKKFRSLIKLILLFRKEKPYILHTLQYGHLEYASRLHNPCSLSIIYIFHLNIT